MLVLALDTATPACVVALCRVEPPGRGNHGERAEHGELAELAELAGQAPVDARRSGELLAPTIASVLDTAGVRAGQVDAVVVGLGPGPFTSLRVGIVTAASLGHALGIPVHGVCSLDAFAVGLEGTEGAGGTESPAGAVGVATDARRRELYWATYSGGVRQSGPAVARPPQVAEAFRSAGVRTILGAGPSLYPELLGAAAGAGADGHLSYPLGRAVAVVGARLLGTDPAPLAPLYLRRPDAAEPHPPRQVTSDRVTG